MDLAGSGPGGGKYNVEPRNIASGAILWRRTSSEARSVTGASLTSRRFWRTSSMPRPLASMRSRARSISATAVSGSSP